MDRKVTVRDVAAAAGVSTATASRVLANNPSVNPEMARRVLKVSAELGYSANFFARALRTKRTDTIGMVVPAVSNAYFVAAVEAVERVLYDSGRSLILCDARDSVEIEALRIDVLVHRMVDGLIVAPVHAYDSVPAIDAAAAQTPVVMLDRWADSAGTDYVGTDNADAVRLIVEHLREQGSTDIVYVGAQPTTSTAYERVKAFREMLGLVPGSAEEAQATLLGEFSAAWGEAAALELLGRETMPDAIVCGADIIAVQLIGTLRNAGVEVPADTRIVSFDGSFLTQVTVPRLTTISQPIDDMAYEAVRILDARAQGSVRTVRKSIFPPSLRIAGSSVAAPQEARDA